MALQPSGPMGLYDIRTEIRGAADTAQIGLLDSNVRTLAGQTSGDVEMPTDFYGKSVIPAAAYSVSAAPNPVDEGNNIYIQVSTINYYVNYQTYIIYWRMIGGISSSITNSDLGGGYQLNTFYEMTLNGSEIGTAAVPITADQSVDAAGDSFYVQLSRDQTSTVYTSAVIDINDTSTAPPPPAPTFSVSLSPSSIPEGPGYGITATVTTTNYSGTIYWRIVHISTNDEDFFGSIYTSGAFSVSTAQPTSDFQITAKADLLTEGNETFYIALRSSPSGPDVATSLQATIEDTSTTPPITYSMTLSKPRLEEGDTLTVTVNTVNFGTGTLYWSIPAGLLSNMTSADFLNITMDQNYAVAIVNNVGTFDITVIKDTIQEATGDIGDIDYLGTNFTIRLKDSSFNIVKGTPTIYVDESEVITGPSTGVPYVSGNPSTEYSVVISDGIPNSSFSYSRDWDSQAPTQYGTLNAQGSYTFTNLRYPDPSPNTTTQFTYQYTFTFAATNHVRVYSITISG